MPYAIGDFSAEYLPNYLIFGMTRDNDPRQAVYAATDDLDYAKQISMTWLINGFASWVTSLNYATIGGMPTQPFVFTNLTSVQAEVPGVSKYCMQLAPTIPPAGLADGDFTNWLTTQSNGTPTFDGTTTVTTAEAPSQPKKEER